MAEQVSKTEEEIHQLVEDDFKQRQRASVINSSSEKAQELIYKFVLGIIIFFVMCFFFMCR